MNYLYLLAKRMIIISFVMQSIPLFSQSSASYNITFTSTWENVTIDPIHGNSTAAIPSNAHWSNLVGTTHNSNYTMVEMGSLASIGIKDVAELGNNNILFSEVNTQIAAGHANQWLEESFSPFNNISSATLNNIEVTSDFPLLSLVSMIAPSPDWMIAINGINLRENNLWKSEIVIPLYPYDAGTDSGENYTSANQPTLPNPDPISSLINQGPFNANLIGILTISLNEVLSIEDNDLRIVLMSPNPSHGKIKITTSRNNPLTEVLVFDTLGKDVAAFGNPNLNFKLDLDLSALNKGVYIVKLRLQDNSISSKRLVIY